MVGENGIYLLSMKETKFKHTEIGLIPEDWEVKKISEVCRNFTGLTYNPENIANYGTLVLRSSNIQNNELTFMDNVYVDMEIPNRAIAKAGDVLVCVRNGSSQLIGKSALITPEAEGMAFGAFMTVLRTSSIDNVYLLQSWRHKRTQDQIHETFGATINQITSKDFNRILIPLPPTKEEQSRIATALYDIDTLIRNLDRTIEKKKNIRQGAMEQLLSGKKRLPGFKGEWIEMRVSEIGKLSGAGIDKKSNPDEVPVRLVNFLDVYHRSRIANCELHHWVTATPEKVQSCNVKRGDIFFTPSSEMPDDIGQSAVAVEDMENVCYSYHIYRLRPFIELDPDYGAYAFQNKYFFDQVKVESEGSGKRYVVSLNKFKELYALLPPTVEEQQAIASTLTAMDDEIAVLQMERDKYANIRSGMMDDLLTGAKRI